jgi:hypothetical protein
MGLIGCPKTSVTSYQSTLRNISEAQRPHGDDNNNYFYKGAQIFPKSRSNL